MDSILATELHDGCGFSPPLPPVPHVRCDGAAFELLTGPRAKCGRRRREDGWRAGRSWRETKRFDGGLEEGVETRCWFACRTRGVARAPFRLSDNYDEAELSFYISMAGSIDSLE